MVTIHWDSLVGPIEGPFTGEVRAMTFLSHGTDETLGFLQERLEKDPSLRIATLPRYEEVVLFSE